MIVIGIMYLLFNLPKRWTAFRIYRLFMIVLLWIMFISVCNTELFHFKTTFRCLQESHTQHFVIVIFFLVYVLRRIHLLKTQSFFKEVLSWDVVVSLAKVIGWLWNSFIENGTYGNGTIINMGNETGGIEVEALADLYYNDLKSVISTGRSKNQTGSSYLSLLLVGFIIVHQSAGITRLLVRSV